MKRINELFHDNKNSKWYDYPVENAEHRSYRVGTKFRVYHKDGSFSTAYLYGEQQFTYDLEELYKVRIKDANKQAYNKEHTALIQQIKQLDNETLKEIIKQYYVA